MAKLKEENSSRITSGLPAEAVVKTKTISWRKVEYEFWGETYSFSGISILSLSLVVGLIGGIYGIGGGAVISPFCVAVLGLPVYTVAGAAVTPDWMLGVLFGIGGLLGTYARFKYRG